MKTVDFIQDLEEVMFFWTVGICSKCNIFVGGDLNAVIGSKQNSVYCIVKHRFLLFPRCGRDGYGSY